MRFITVVVVLLSLVLAAFSNPIHNVRQSKEIAQRRQFVGYSNNIVHENPSYPDQSAQSAVKVNFHSNQIEPRKQIYASNPYQKPEFSQPYTQNYPTDAPQSQLFNVGYSVSFTNGNNQPPKPQPPPKYPRKNNLDDAEIITGIRKQNEEVEIPSINMSPQEYVSSAFINNKKQKISGIKPKPQYITSFSNPKVLLTQANLSPSTQKFYKTLEQIKPQVQNTQELQQKYSWRNLSPGVEIIRSTEVPTALKYTRSEHTVQFDHAKALGRSQDFDYTNALDNNNAPQQNALYYSHLRKPQPQIEKLPQQIPVMISQNIPKLPLDTSLLREQIPIQIDTRFVDEAMRNQLMLYANSKYSQPQEQGPQQINYSQQAYRTIPVEENIQNKPIQVVYEQEQQEPQRFQDYQTDQNRFLLKIYGKPQPLGVAYNNEQNEQLKRQPRFLNDLHTNLRPPPNVPYQRRILVG